MDRRLPIRTDVAAEGCVGFLPPVAEASGIVSPRNVNPLFLIRCRLGNTALQSGRVDALAQLLLLTHKTRTKRC